MNSDSTACRKAFEVTAVDQANRAFGDLSTHEAQSATRLAKSTTASYHKSFVVLACRILGVLAASLIGAGGGPGGIGPGAAGTGVSALVVVR